MSRFFILFLLLFHFNHFIAISQERQVANQTNGWLGLFSTVKFHPKWGVSNEFQLRMHQVVDSKQQYFFRTSVNFFPAKKIFFSLGYAIIKTFPYGELPGPYKFLEHRMWQGMEINDKISRFHLNHRFRMEQRWLEAKVRQPVLFNLERADWNFVNRIRYRFLTNIPLNKKEMEKGTFFVNLSNEIFINFGKRIDKNIFDQNRAFIGLGFQFLPKATVLFGYLNQFASKSDAVRFENNHTLNLNLFYNFDLFKKTEQ